VDVFLAPSEFIRDKYVEFGIPKEKIAISRYGLNAGLFTGLQKNQSGRLRFGFIGTLLPAKGPDLLIKAFNGIKNQDAQLLIYGALRSYTGFEHYLPYLKKIRKNRNIEFMGGFDNRDIASVFQNIDILVVPSVWPENSPLVIQESFLARTPVIASRIGGIPELVEDQISGLLFNTSDTGELQGKIKDIIDNRVIIEKLKANIPRVKNIEDNARELEMIYCELCRR
jgi:glycosyltransferase involved in cell wall biosynthesis